MALIEVRGLEKTFVVPKQRSGAGVFGRLRREMVAVKAVDGVSFAVERGEMVGYIGPNGEPGRVIPYNLKATVEGTTETLSLSADYIIRIWLDCPASFETGNFLGGR